MKVLNVLNGAGADAAKTLGERLKGKTGRRYWKSLEQLAETPEFQKWVEDEFPHRASLAQLDRRDFLKFMGASLMLAGLGAAGCRRLPDERLVPFIAGPDDRVYGKPVYFASISTVGGYATGVKVKTDDGRPIKLDGNPRHPASLGALDARTQARVLDMYDPDRLRMPIKLGEPTSWHAFSTEVEAKMAEFATSGGAGVALLTQTVGSPSYQAQVNAFLLKYPRAQWVQYEPVNDGNRAKAATMAFGNDLETHHDYAAANVVLSLDCDAMMDGPACVRTQHDLMSKRNLGEGGKAMSRVYAVECTPTTLGVIADHRLPLRASAVMGFARALAGRLGVPGVGTAPAPPGVDEKWISGLAADLVANPGASIVVAGSHQPADVHALVHLINEHLGNAGKTVFHTEPFVQKRGSQAGDLKSLVASMAAGHVRALFVLDGNPTYDSPADVDFKGALAKVPLSVHLSSHDNETSEGCVWRMPLSHFLECWGDGRAYDGTASIQQPTILPLYDSRSEIEFIEWLNGGSRDGLTIVQSTWKAAWGEAAFTDKWQASLSSGVVEGSASAPVATAAIAGLAGALRPGDTPSGIELVILHDPTIYDGRYGNNGWLQELPKPISNLTWDNAAYMSYSTAVQLGVPTDTKYLGLIPADGAAPMVNITVDGRNVEAAVYVNHGMADGVVLVHLGFGRTRGGKVLLPLRDDSDPYEGGGFDAYRLYRSAENPHMVVNGAKVEVSSNHYPLANTQFHNTIDTTPIDSEREILVEMSLDEFINGKPKVEKKNDSLYDRDLVAEALPQGVKDRAPSLDDSTVDKQGWDDPKNYQWAMTIDLTLCTGCNACVIACQSENNIPTVGKYQVQRHREMHWIRIDRYYAGTGPESEWPVKDPVIRFQPVTCMHCENAPCEPVCPVAATVHSKEGLNQMVYNRCVGTRYCSNNCPYKVRRFNFLNYGNHDDVPVRALLNNPDVTVRGRGVMEKCTYCVQRIDHARIEAKKRGERIKDGEVTTACMDACPSRAIIFGDKTDLKSVLATRLADKRAYKLLDDELNTRPRTTYLARVTNPNREVEA